MGREWAARSRTVRVVFEGRAEASTEWTQVEMEGPILGERVEQTMRAILIVGSAMMVVLMLTVVVWWKGRLCRLDREMAVDAEEVLYFLMGEWQSS